MRAVFLLPLCFLSVAALAQEPAPAVVGDVTEVKVVRGMEQHVGAALLWEPYIAQWKPKQLIVAYGAGIPGKTDMGDIWASVSTDDGAKWSEPALIFDHNQRLGGTQYGYANAVLYKAPEQDVAWCFAMRCPMNYQHSEDSQLAAAYTGDGGRSWTPVELAMHYTGPLIIVGGIQRIVENGVPRYLLPAHRNTRRNDPLGSRDQFMLSSTTLLEWRLAGHIPKPASGPVFLHEGNLAYGENEQELKLVMRTAQDGEKDNVPLDPPRAFSSVSRDGGRTWSAAQQEPDLWNSVSKGFYGKAATGAHVYVYSDGPAWSRMALRYKVQPASGAWGEEKSFYDSGTHNSYPTLIEVGPGDFRAVWDSGTKERWRTQIRFGKLRLR